MQDENELDNNSLYGLRSIKIRYLHEIEGGFLILLDKQVI